jgi:hypothetical protein
MLTIYYATDLRISPGPTDPGLHHPPLLENSSDHVRDRSSSKMPAPPGTGTAPQAMASRGNLTIRLPHTTDATHRTSATRHYNRSVASRGPAFTLEAETSLPLGEHQPA